MSVKTHTKKRPPVALIRKLHMETSVDDILEVLNRMDERERKEFEKQLIEFTCNEIKEKVAKNPSMNLLEEETLEDGSVVLTINV